ncbi:Protein CBG25232 [Caenorhabditis briggsae]|uniref:Protein CBG25232 n=1 Tax=Caenorhabditis briggsae TaxID=6238 RepID=B6IFK2_CAEBR|nr:Protein CBG25232 [Caenorhabditis briggsae]CAR98682.1 Protein CBG25232 [Caenorhabditis briggsae]
MFLLILFLTCCSFARRLFLFFLYIIQQLAPLCSMYFEFFVQFDMVLQTPFSSDLSIKNIEL